MQGSNPQFPRHHPCIAYSNIYERLLQCRVAQTTRRTYQSGLARYYSFCSQYHLTTILVSFLTLQYFCAQQSQHTSYRTIKVYLACIQLAHIEAGMPDPSLLQLVCRGPANQHTTTVLHPLLYSLAHHRQPLMYFEEPIRPISLQLQRTMNAMGCI